MANPFANQQSQPLPITPLPNSTLGILTWTCPACQKKMVSMYPNQLKVFAHMHEFKHDLQKQQEHLKA